MSLPPFLSLPRPGWSLNFINTHVSELIFTPTKTTCDISTVGDGTCDSGNNDMACDFDGGDCCEDTCVSDDASDDGNKCNYFTECKGPHATEWAFWSPVDTPSYPFNTQEALLSVMEAKAGSEASAAAYGYKDLPSLSCPDCAAYNGSFLSVPFDVNAGTRASDAGPPPTRPARKPPPRMSPVCSNQRLASLSVGFIAHSQGHPHAAPPLFPQIRLVFLRIQCSLR